MKQNQIAINSVSTRQPSLEEALSAYAAAGFRQVELSLSQVRELAGCDLSADDLKEQLARHGLTCIGGFEAAVLCFADDAEQRKNHDLHISNARLLDQLGGGVLVMGTDGPGDGILRDEAVSVIGKTLRRLAEQVPESVRLAVEFNWSPIIRSLASAVAVAEAADHERVGVLFDTAHYYCTPTKFEDLTDRAIGKILHVHINDMADKPADLSDCNADRVLPGEGVLDLPRIISRLEDGGYDRLFAIEMFNEELWAVPGAEAARRCYEAMRSLCGG